MKSVCRRAWLVTVLVAAGVLWCCDGRHLARAQVSLTAGNEFELSDTVQLDRADNTALAHDLQRAQAYLDAEQWDEAIETLRGVMEGSGEKLWAVAERRYVRLRDYCHLQLASMPAEALKLYRARVDPLARKWYEEGVAKRDRRLLLDVVEQAFASSWGDDALLALGEMALESGDYASARWHWERIVPHSDAPRTWPGYPDTDIGLAGIRAKLVLVSILEGSIDRAREELAQFEGKHSDARGRLGHREGNYVETLRGLLAESPTWPRPKPNPDWPTFAGSTARNKIAPEMIEVAQVAWRLPLCKVDPAADAPLSFHPLLVGDLVLVNNRREIMAAGALTGKPAWGGVGANIYRAEFAGAAGTFSEPSNTLGVPRFTMTVFEEKLYARMGTAVTSGPQEPDRPIRPGYLVCLDLAAEGRLLWKIVPEAGWAFEGSPVADEANVYVAMRRSDVRPQAHVGCFDARTGRRRWRRFVCGAETPARGILYQCTHNLLTLQRETLYYNTNLGAVAAISARDGRLKWVSLYHPRARRGDLLKLAPHWQRDLNPCLYDRGTLLVAPADSPRIFALDAVTGQMLWRRPPEVPDVVHLLGTTDEHLIASGHKLYWIGLKGKDKGRVKHVWPDGHEKLGYGRGVLTADSVLWPTREKIYVFDRKTARPKRVIDLVPLGLSGGNLLAAGGRLLIATPTELIALSRHGGRPRETPVATSSRRVHATRYFPAWTPGLNSTVDIPRRGRRG